MLLLPVVGDHGPLVVGQVPAELLHPDAKVVSLTRQRVKVTALLDVSRCLQKVPFVPGDRPSNGRGFTRKRSQVRALYRPPQS